MNDNSALESLRYNADGFNLYRAGMYGFDNHKWGPVMRDLLLSAIIMHDSNLLEESFHFACYTQGKRYDPITGEEPGRILHEREEVDIKGLKTRFNSCDSTLLFLIASSLLPEEVLEENEACITMAKNWLISHINQAGVFIEDPSFCGAEKYALKATYWKDSGLPKRRKIGYPVDFFLTQAQALKALQVADAPMEIRLKVKEALFNKLWPKRLPYIAIDKKGPIEGISSDFLHSLYYLEPEDIPDGSLSVINSIAKVLETPVGFRTYAPGQSGYHPRGYQRGAIWPFEQYFIAEGAKRHGLEGIARTAESCSGFEGFPELIDWENGKIRNLGHRLQLWTVAYKLRQVN